MSNDPDRIREEIETTTMELSTDVDALTYKANPRRMATERVDRARGRLARIKDIVMGSTTRTRYDGGHAPGEARQRLSGAADQAQARLSGTAQQAQDRLSGTAHQAQNRLSGAAQQAQAVPQMARERAEGNPLAAGLIAFGVGLLASSLMRPSERERRIAEQAKHKAMERSGQFKQQAGEVAHGMTQGMQQNLRQPAMEAAKHVGSAAAHGVSEIREQGRSAAQQVQGQARESQSELRR